MQFDQLADIRLAGDSWDGARELGQGFAETRPSDFASRHGRASA